MVGGAKPEGHQCCKRVLVLTGGCIFLSCNHQLRGAVNRSCLVREAKKQLKARPNAGGKFTKLYWVVVEILRVMIESENAQIVPLNPKLYATMAGEA